MIAGHRFIKTLFAAIAVIVLILGLTTGVMAAPKALVVADGMSYTLPPGPTTINLNKLVIGEGANLVAPAGYSVSLTVNGVETGQAMADTMGAVPNFAVTSGVKTAFLPGTYLGNIVITVAEANPMVYNPSYTFPFRQALYLDETGIVESKSVLAAVVGKKPTAYDIKNILISSTGECFNGVVVTGGNYSITNAKIDLVGNGRSDFIGYGSAVTVRGENTTLVLDKARITTDGVVRTGVVADTGSNTIVKNSYIQILDGELPGDYFNTIDTTQMRSAPWMLGCMGTTRATNLLGGNGTNTAPGTIRTKASYINSYIGAEGWGVLSTDGCRWPILTVINSTIATTGETGGYGSYVIGQATEYFYGCTFNVGTYANIMKGGWVYYDDSTPENVAELNVAIPLLLTAKELKDIPNKPTVVNSENWGAKWHGGGTVNVAGGTAFNTKNACFLVKNQTAEINVDGSKGAQFNPTDGIILEVIDMDDVGPNFPISNINDKWYYELAVPPVRNTTLDQRIATANAVTATFAHIDLEGDFYNSVGWTPNDDPFVPGLPAPSKRNLVLTLDDASLAGVISATQAHHEYMGVQYPFIDIDTYYALGHLVNTPHPVVNSGVIVFLKNGATWKVTGTSYLSKLDIAADAMVTAPAGYEIVMYVDGVETAIVPGYVYVGDIELTLE